MRDPRVVRLVYEQEIVRLPGDLEEAVPRKDLYLVELAAVSPDRTIVTTDCDLRERVNGLEGFHVLLLEEFLQEVT